MKVAKIAAAPMLRMIGQALADFGAGEAADREHAIAIKISDGTLPVSGEAADDADAG